MSTNGSRWAAVPSLLADIPPRVLEDVAVVMRALQASQLTFDLHENRVTVTATSLYRTTV